MKIKHGIAAAAALVLLLITGPAIFAASPGRVSYQGTLRKNGILFSGATTMQFRLTNADGSSVYWTSGSTDVVVSTGLFRYALGSPNEVDFAAISWKEITPYVQMNLDGSWLPREPLYASVYSLHANTAESSTGTFTINGGDLRLSDASGSKGIYFPDGTAQYSAPGWAVTGAYTSFAGGAGVGTLTPATRLDVKAAGGDSYVQFWRDSAGVIRATMTAAGVLYANGSQLSGADNMGNHTATTALNMAGNQIVNASSVTVAGSSGVGSPRLTLSPGVGISSTTAASMGGVYISTHMFLPAGARYYGDGSALGGVNDSFGSHTATKTVNLAGNQIVNLSSLTVTGPVGVGAAVQFNPNVQLSFAPGLYSGVFISTNVNLAAGAKYYGDGSGLSGVVGEDNLGDHTLAQNLATGSNWVSYDGSASGLSFDAAGNVGLGQAAGAARLDVRSAVGATIQRWSNGGTVIASMSALGFYADGSQLRNLPAGGTATRALNMASFDITGVSTMSAGYLSSPGAGVVFTTNALVMGGRLGIDTLAPQEKLHVNGNIRSSGLSGLGIKCVQVDNNGVLGLSADACGLAGVGGDDLGDYTMWSNLLTNGRWVSGDGGSEGLTVGGDGKVGVGLSGAAANLDVQAASGDTYAQIWRDSLGLDVASMSATGYIYADASKMRNLPSGGDSFGSHTATQAVNMGGNQIVNASSITVTNGLGLGAARLTLNSGVAVSSESAAGFAGVRVSSNVYIVGFSSAARYFGDGSQLTNIAVTGDGLGTHTATLDLNLAGNEIVGVSTITVGYLSSAGPGVVFTTNAIVMGGRLGINTALPQESLDVNGNIMSTSLSGFGDKCVTADNTGKLYLAGDACGSAAGLDNMGNHLMTTNLQTGSSWISGDGGNEGLRIDSLGNISIGDSVNNARLDVRGAVGNYIQVWRDVAGAIQSSMSVTGVLYADASQMRNLPSGADHLGNHTATTNLNMATFDINSVSTITAGYLTSSGAGVVFTTNALVMGGWLGVNTTLPQASLDVNGNFKTSSLAGAGVRCVHVTNAGELQLAGSDCGTIAGNDNMGDHIMTTDLVAGNYWISGDGDAEGLRVDAAGNVSVGTNTANARLDVKGSVGNYMQIWRTFADVVQASMSVTGVLYADGSKLRNLPVGADSLGAHIATTTLQMAGFAINNVSSMTATGQITTYSSATVAGPLGLGAARLSLAPGAEISSTTAARYGGVYVSTHVYLPAGAKYYGDGSALGGVNDGLGNHIADQDLNMSGFRVLNASSLEAARLSLSPNVELSSETTAGLGAGVRISSNVYIVGFSSAAKFYGDGSGLTGVISSPDNLGNHTATLDIDLAGNDLVGVSTLTAGYLSSQGAGVAFTTNAFILGGRLGINTSLPQESLDVNGNILSSGLSGSGDQCVYADNTGRLQLSMVGACGSATGNDNLGNHIMTTNLMTNGNWIAYGPGAGGGLSVNISSNVGIGILSAATRLDVQAAALDPYVQIWRDSGGIDRASMTASGTLYASASGLRNLPAETDPVFMGHPAYAVIAGERDNWNTAYGWGDHAAPAYSRLSSTQTFTGANTFSSFAGFTAQDGALPGLYVSSGIAVAGGSVGLGLGMVSPAARLDVQAEGAGTYVQIWRDPSGVELASMTAAGVLYADGSALRGIAAGGGTLATILAASGDASGGYVVNLASLAIARADANEAPLEVQTVAGTNNIQIWRAFDGVGMATMTAGGTLTGQGAILKDIYVDSITINNRLAVGNGSSIDSGILSFTMGLFDDGEIKNSVDGFNAGVVGNALVSPTGDRSGFENVIGGRFIGGIDSGNTFDFPALIGVSATAWAMGVDPSVITNAYGVYVKNIQESGTVTNNFGIKIATPDLTGLHDNIYGLYVEPHAGGGISTYNIFSAGTNSLNRFEGKVRVDGELEMRLPSKLLINFLTLDPVEAGELYYCSDCTVSKLVISTGPAVGSFTSAMGGAPN